jgi:hypothetical protein
MDYYLATEVPILGPVAHNPTRTAVWITQEGKFSDTEPKYMFIYILCFERSAHKKTSFMVTGKYTYKNTYIYCVSPPTWDALNVVLRTQFDHHAAFSRS